ncbi:toxin-antitoxin system YwqK family antitoxin [Myxococcus xanthus]|uniref:toxin-antitoxin system YwqK family antitoxin n=1 Tax=Myxococcus xanthus TaxID=34 RepID=UPI001125EA21|nr:hypothetical protein [Myxococcus xanthus]QDE84524.1 hypothetical protein BHS07_24875 [Myxococcus xanthus]QDF06343.1 hypothetical protein BHS04_24540 [Myxococcus xanthus]
MLIGNLMRALPLTLALMAPAALAKAPADKAACPAGTVQTGAKTEGLTCSKVDAQLGQSTAHGAYVAYHPNGKLAARGQFENGLKVGLWTFFDESGVIEGTSEFKDGGWHGQRIKYFPSGKPQRIEEYKDGRKNGLVKEFAEDGRVLSQVQYENNRVVSAQ